MDVKTLQLLFCSQPSKMRKRSLTNCTEIVIWHYAGISPIKSVMWPILASLIGQFQRRVKFYTGILFISLGPVLSRKNASNIFNHLNATRQSSFWREKKSLERNDPVAVKFRTKERERMAQLDASAKIKDARKGEGERGGGEKWWKSSEVERTK